METETPDTPAAVLHVAPAPHLSGTALGTRRMMIDVLIALVPALVMAIIVFRWHAVVVVGLCVLACMGAEAVLSWMRGRRVPIGDFSAAVTGIILGLSLPWSASGRWYIAVIGSVAAIGLGKAVFGGLGYNIFNPAMVGRAFVMLSFAGAMGAGAYVDVQEKIAEQDRLVVVTRATPLSVAKKFAADLTAGKVTLDQTSVELENARKPWPLFTGQVNGSLGEVSALALLIGGIYLCLRRVASWQIPAGMLLTAFAFTELGYLAGLTPFTPLQHMISGALLLGAFFIATDPVTSPVTSSGKFIFGAGVGLLVVLIRLFSNYPEGVMFAVLLMNTATPLINRWTIPRPLGGPPKKT